MKKTIQTTRNIRQKGMIINYVLFFGIVFLILLAGLLGFILMQLKQSAQKISWNQSLSVAEAGISWYRWCLNNGVESNCSGEHDYFDSDGNLLGKFNIDSTSVAYCGQTTQRQIISEGWTEKFPDLKRKIKVLYARESIAKYAYVLNDNVWIGSDHEIRGPYHSNGGVRMDGENQSLMTSSATRGSDGEWICTSSFGCSVCPLSATQPCYTENGSCICPSVFTTTANSNPSLFDYPVPPFDFNGMTVDLAQIKNIAQTGGGIYIPQSTSLNPNGKGYRIVFKSNGTFEAWVITALSRTYAYSIEEGWHYDYFTISNQYLYNTYVVPPNCSVIYVEDDIWPEGQVKGKVVLASANLVQTNVDTDVVLAPEINYVNLDGTDGLALIGERNVLIGPQSPDQMELRGIFIAQKGRFGRNHYPDNFRDKLEINGSIVSYGRVGTQWVSGSQIISGYIQRETYFDQNLIYNPPPFISYIDPEFKIVSWEEME